MALLAQDIPKLLIQSTQMEIGRHLALDRLRTDQSAMSLHEYFPVFGVNVRAMIEKPSQEGTWRDYLITTGRWHVQVHSQGKPVGFARVLALETPRVVGYTKTDVAIDIDRAIEIADSADLPDSLHASIVEIPSLRVAGLMLAPPGVVDSPTAYLIVYELPIQQVRIERFTVYSVPELMSKLRLATHDMNSSRQARRSRSAADPAVND